MKAITTFLGSALLVLILTSCDTEMVIGDGYNAPTLNEVLASNELWYVDLNNTQGNPDLPFMTQAFTLSFDFGTLYANNNLVGVGNAGAGLGIDVGTYHTINNQLAIDHDIDGLHNFEVRVWEFDRLELKDLYTNTSYFLDGYNRNTFDYDQLFYDNIQYFLQEYQAWEKVHTSQLGVVNYFDQENYLRFFQENNTPIFESSRDINGLNISNLFWDFSGVYIVQDQTPGSINKQLTLGYDFIGNDFFDLYIVNDHTIELYHIESGSTYRFKGRGFIQLKNSSDVSSTKNRMLDFNRAQKNKK
jgi:hypothetical protein